MTKSSSQLIFEKVRTAFLDELDDRIQLISQHWNVVNSTDNLNVDYAEIIRLVHNLAGSASTFKLDSLHNTVRQIEHLLLQLADTVSHDEVQQLTSQVANLIHHLHQPKL